NGLGIVETYREVTFRQAIDPITGKLWAPLGQNNIPEFNNGIDPLNGAKGKQSSGFMIIPYIDFDLPYLFTPSMGISYKPPEPQYSRWTFGFAQFAPFGAGLKNEANSPLSFLGQEAWFVRMSFLTPAIAYKFSDTVS